MWIYCGRAFVNTVLFVVFSTLFATAQPVVTGKAPSLKAIFPLGIASGQQVEAVVSGDNLKSVNAAWFDCGSLTGRVIHSSENEAHVEIRAQPGAVSGFHVFYLLSPGGMSTPLALFVSADTVSDRKAGPVALFPALLNGRLPKPGSLDEIVIEGRRDRALRIEAITNSGLLETNTGEFSKPVVKVLRSEGSWLDANEHPELLCDIESQTFEFPRLTFIEHDLRRLVCHFPSDGRYIVQTGGGGGPGFSYSLRITPASDANEPWIPRVLAHGDPYDYDQLRFTRRLDSGRLKMLAQRAPGYHAPAPMAEITEREPNDAINQAQPIRVPALLEGRIGRPGDVDVYRLEAEAGQAVAFEVETPILPAPIFSPKLSVLDSAGQELVSNIYRKIDGDGDDWIKSIEPKTLFTFPSRGVYYVQIRDLTSRYGGDAYAYRLLIRPQIPHVGRVTIRHSGMGFQTRLEDHLDVMRGRGVRIAIVSEQEEGLDCDLAVDLVNLPPGVHASAAPFIRQKGIYVIEDEVYETRWEGLQNVHRERYRPRRRVMSLFLTADANVPPMPAPQLVRVVVTPVVDGKQLTPIVTQQLPLLVGEDTGTAAKRAAIPIEEK